MDASYAAVSYASPRILGLGWGLFLLIAVGVILAIVLAVTYRSQSFQSIAITSITVYALLAAILILPKKVDPAILYGASAKSSSSSTWTADDIKYLVRWSLTFVNALALALNSGAWFWVRVWRPVIAKDKDYQAGM